MGGMVGINENVHLNIDQTFGVEPDGGMGCVHVTRLYEKLGEEKGGRKQQNRE
jgi:hypothetical protein